MAIDASARTKPKQTRKEHIVPRLMLANFTDASGVLLVYTEDNPARPSIPAVGLRKR